MNFDVVIENGTIVTLNTDFDVIEDGIVCIKNGKLVRVEAKTVDSTRPAALERIDAKGGIIMPGLINTHTHLPMTIFRGLADDLPLSVWLNEHIFPAEGKFIEPESVRNGTLLACAEMLLSGTTTCCDGYFFENNVALAVHESGMRAVLGQGVIDFPAPGVPDPSDNIKTAQTFAEKWQGASAVITPSIFCHSPYTCSADTLKKAKKIASEMGLLFQIHSAETENESKQIFSAHQKNPIRYLDDCGILDPHSLLVHAIWVDDEDKELIARRGANVSHNPESNMKLAAGIAPVPEYLQSGIPVGLGTDGCASNNDLDLFQVMDVTAKLHKVHTMDPTALDARSVLEMATIGGARAIGLKKEIGSLEPGKQADVMVIDIHKPHLVPLYNPASHLVYAAKGSDVRTVLVAGKVLMRDRRLQTLDLEDILARAEHLGQAIFAQNRAAS